MSVLYSETFTGANANPIGGVWTTGSGWAALQRISNLVDGTSGDSGAYVSTVVPPNDQYSKVTLGAAFTTDGGPFVRAATGAKTHYLLDIAASCQLYRVSAGVYTTIGAAFSHTAVIGDVYEIRAVGTTISGWINGVQQRTVSDANIASGRFGIFISGTSLRFSSFEGGDFTTSGDTLMGQSCL